MKQAGFLKTICFICKPCLLHPFIFYLAKLDFTDKDPLKTDALHIHLKQKGFFNIEIFIFFQFEKFGRKKPQKSAENKNKCPHSYWLELMNVKIS